MDSLDGYEIESIWERVRFLVDISKIKSVKPEDVQKEIKSQLSKNPQSKLNILIDKGFPRLVSENVIIKKDLFTTKIKEVQTKRGNRYQIAKGVITFKFKGLNVKAGQFIKGKTKEQAVLNLINKTK